MPKFSILKSFYTILIAALLPVSLINTDAHADAIKKASITKETPEPYRFVVRGTNIVDKTNNKTLFFKGIGYSPYLPNETPLQGDGPGNDNRYSAHLPLMRAMGANYLHVFPINMPGNFFKEMDTTDFVYGQDMFVWAYEKDFLADEFQQKTLNDLRKVIDHTYQIGRPDRLVVFSVGDELQSESVILTDRKHPEVNAYSGKHINVSNRTPTEVALAKLIDEAMDYELSTYGKRHLYCHTSWTHIGPISDRKDLEVPYENVLSADMGDIICMNIYTYARGVRSSAPGSVTKTSYQGYLEDLAKQSKKPIFITQVGFSTSPFEPKPWVPGFGGHKIEDIPNKLAYIWKDLRTAKGKEKYCGICFFELNDEWWKSGDYPEDKTKHEQEDPEEWFGIYEVAPDSSLKPKGRIPEAIKTLFSEKPSR